MTPTILLLYVEDDDFILDVMGEALAEAGFGVTAASNGSQAMAELNADASRFRAVITDVRLGQGPDGWQIGRRARELVHDMPVIYMSGDSSHEWSSKGVPNSVMLAKPFAPAQLITAVSTLMNNVDSHKGLG